MGTVRLSVDVAIEKGDPQRIVQALSKKENREQAANFVANVLIPDVIESAEASTVGAFVHYHDHERTGTCDTDVREARTYLPDFDN